ncbi:hypothetical protein [Konateibacter massiliensis]|uniref:hypothetical protein n=1 Tax=Konateibacter massiliensis TaxID=2002841 RepID=UPI0015D4A7F5|nr:hypothetical protein [Konateibacter massiliensis]
MSSIATTTIAKEKNENFSEKASFDALYHELEKGIQSMKNGDVYTIEEAWEEIDKI